MQILHKPIISEKSIKDAAKGYFTFSVKPTFSKREIKKEVEKLFSVHVKDITTVLRKGKRKQTGRKRRMVQKPSVKIARLKLAKGEKIDLFEAAKAI